MGKVGIIGGTSLLQSAFFTQLSPERVETPEGNAYIHVSADGELVFVQRHHSNGDDPETYVPPHRINHRANLLALQKLGVEKVLAVCSVGSLQTVHPIGTLMIPDDYFNLFCGVVSMFDDKRGHNVPGLDAPLRDDLVSGLAGISSLKNGGVYVQTLGPRFETPAEVRFLSTVGDVVGMTGASEATMAKDLGLAYAIICMVDNFANGLVGDKLTEQEFKANVALNQKTVEGAVETMIAKWKGTVSVDGPMKEKADSIISAAWFIPVEPEGVILENSSIVLLQGKIQAIVPSDAAARNYDASDVVDLPNHVLIPGLVNAHTHSGMSLMRGKADDENLFKWLRETVWPIEAAFVGEEFCRDGAMLAVMEMLRGGITCFSDMYWYPVVGARVASTIGIRAVIGMILIGFPSGYASTTQEYIDKGHEVQAEFDQDPLISFTYAPHAPYTVPDAVWEQIQVLSTKNNTIVHTHLHETLDECLASKQLNRDSPSCHLSEYPLSPVENFKRLGLLNHRLTAAHMVHLTDDEIDQCAQGRVSIVHCPTSNMKLASGFCRTARLLEAGVNVALGTDSAASNNSLDLIQEMKAAALMAKNVSGDSTVVPAHTALRMGTLNGAIALGLDEVTGSLVPGKDADIVAVELGTRATTAPVYNAASALVYSASREDVSDVWVRGTRVLAHGKHTTVDTHQLLDRVQSWAKRIHDHVDLHMT